MSAIEAWTSTFYPFQQEWLFDDADLAIENKSRQIGTSHTTAAVLTRWGAFHGELTTIISIGDRESKEVLEKCRRHATILRRLGSRMAEVGTKDNANELTFASGGRIIALPSSGGRSFSGNVFLDEFAYHEHASKVWDAAVPVTLLGYKLRVVSTPNGVGNEFYVTWTKANEPGSGWSTHEVPIDKAIAQGYPVDLDRCWRLAKGDQRVFDQMFRCSFLDNELQYIPTETIELCSTTEPIGPGPGDHYAGLDIGRENDLAVLLVVRFHRGIRTVVHVEMMKRTAFEEIQARAGAAFERFKLKRLCVDQTGIGMETAERLKKKYSERIDVPHRRPRVEPITFTLKTKEMLATGLYALMTEGQVVLPKTDEALPGCSPGTAKRLRDDIAAIRRVVTTAGNVTYDAPRTVEGHADTAWALALAVHASTGRNAMADALLGQ